MKRNGVKTGNWTDEEKEKLKEMVNEHHLSNKKIAKRLNRTENAIRSRKYLMGLTNKEE